MLIGNEAKSNFSDRSIEDLILYTRLMEGLFIMFANEHKMDPNLKYFRNVFCPEWSDILEVDIDETYDV